MFNFLKRKTALSKFQGTIAEEYEEYGSTYTDHAMIKKCLDYYKTDPDLHLVVETDVAYSVGDGYRLVLESEDSMAEKNLEVVKDFLDEHQAGRFFENLAREVHLCGNSFFHLAGKNNDDPQGLIHIPLDSITEIRRDRMGKILSYVQTMENYIEIKPDTMLHFCRGNINGSPWGSARGQLYVAPGVGYKANNKLVHAPSMAETAEMLRHTASRSAYVGTPKHVVSHTDMKPQEHAALAQSISRMEPGSSMVANKELKVDVMSFGGRSSFGDHYTYLTHAIGKVMMSPVPAMFPEPSNFAYASADKVSEMMFPMMDSFQRDLQMFIEQKIFRPLITSRSAHAWDKYPIRIRFDKENAPGPDDLFRLADTKLKGMPIDWGEIIDAMADAGLPAKRGDGTVSPQQAQALARHIAAGKQARILDKIGSEILGGNI